MIYFDHNRNQESEAAFAAALAAPGLNGDFECKARFYRAQSVWKARQRPRAAPLFDEADGICAKAGNRDLHAKALYQGARAYASAGNRDAAMLALHPDRGRARRPQLRRRRADTDGGARQRRRRRGRRSQDPGRGADALPAGRSLERGALAAGVRGLARRPPRRGGALAGREPAPRPARGDLVRRGARPILEGARAREAGARRRRARLLRAGGARVPAVGLRAAGAGAAEIVGPPRRGGAGHLAAQGPPRGAGLVVPAARALRRSRVPARGRARAHGPGLGRPAGARQAGAGDVGRQARAGRGRGGRPGRGGGPPLDHRHAARPRRRLERVALAPALRRDLLPPRVSTGARRREVEARLPARVPGARRQEHQGQQSPGSAGAGDHARGERLFTEDRVIRQRHRPHADAGEDGQALLRRRARHARGAARSGQERRAGGAFSRFPLEAFRRYGAADDRRLQRGRIGGRPLARRSRRPRHG